MKVLSVSALALGAVAALASRSVEGSNYPPDYPFKMSCASDGPVKVCAVNKDMILPYVGVEYRGYLLNEENQAGKISVWAKLNNRDGTFKMTHNPPYPDAPAYEYKALGGISNVTCCWNYTEAPQEEKNLFFYAFDQNGRPNAWDIELAFVGEDGKWDSKYGQNYKFRL